MCAACCKHGSCCPWLRSVHERRLRQTGDDAIAYNFLLQHFFLPAMWFCADALSAPSIVVCAPLSSQPVWLHASAIWLHVPLQAMCKVSQNPNTCKRQRHVHCGCWHVRCDRAH